MAKKEKTHHKHRGFWASFWLIIFGLQSILYIFLIYDWLNQTDTIPKPYLLGGLILVALADLIGLAGIWFWKKWGWYLFAISSIGSVVLGLISTGTGLIAINKILPFVILGWVYKDKWDDIN